jgi:glycosyltransferase involved in cell wall biosynthesis
VNRSTARPGLSVIMPFFNEAALLEQSVAAVSGHLAASGHDYEIILVDDASSDESTAIAQRLAAAGERVRCFRHSVNQGPCSGLKTAAAQVEREWALLLPVDLAIPLEEIDRLWQARAGADIVLGYIRCSESRSRRRRLQSSVYTALVNLLFGTRLKQINYVALYRASLLRRLPLTCSGVALHAEILVRALRAGQVVTQLDLAYRPRTAGTASGARLGVILRTIGEIFKLRRTLG